VKKMALRRSTTFTGAASAAFCVLASATPLRAVVPDYGVLDLGTFGGNESQSYDINSAGQVVGYARDASGIKRAFRTAANSAINPATDMIPFVSGGASYNEATAINSSGQVAGHSDSSDGDRAYRRTGASNTTINPFRGDWSYAEGINDTGQVVGGASDGNGPSAPTLPFMWNGSTIVALGSFSGSDYGYAYGINSAGKAVGYVSAPNFQERAFLWTPTTPNGTTGSRLDLGALGGGYSYAYDINDLDHIVGTASTPGDLESHAFLRTTGPNLIDLGTLGGSGSDALALNGSDWVVGQALNSASQQRAFLWADGVMHDLNSLIDPGDGWTLLSARGINDLGQIVGGGTNSSGELHAFLATPLPTWKVDASGDWSAAGNWFASVPSGVGAEARFTGAITAPRLVTLDTPRTVGRIIFDNPQTYTLAGQTLTFSGSSGSTGVRVRGGAHNITAPVVFSGNASITIDAGAALKLSGPISGAVMSLNLDTGATLDLADNDLVIDYDPLDGSPLPGVLAALASAYNNGAWNGAGITSSAAAGDATQKTALGAGETGSPDASSVLIKFTYYGDATLDGQVDVGDLGRLASAWQGAGTWSDGDFDFDGSVNVNDLGLLAINWLAGVGNPLGPDFASAAAALGLPAAVPEPAAALTGLVLAAITLRRPRR
jgi:probable HAF family extracellular repeat protein